MSQSLLVHLLSLTATLGGDHRLVPELGRFVMFRSKFPQAIYSLLSASPSSALSVRYVPYAKMTSIRSLGISTTAQGRNAWCISSLDTHNRSIRSPHQLPPGYPTQVNPYPTLTHSYF